MDWKSIAVINSSYTDVYLVVIGLHPKIRTAMFHKHVVLHERVWIQQQSDSLSSSQLPLTTHTHIQFHKTLLTSALRPKYSLLFTPHAFPSFSKRLQNKGCPNTDL